MDSRQRHEARRKRRDAKRAANRAGRIKDCTIENVAGMDNLDKAARKAASGVRWKATTQRYMADETLRISEAGKTLLSGGDLHAGYTRFDVVERGKVRHITAVRFPERVVQKSLSQNALAPAIWPTLTPGCSANMKGRGTSYAVRRLKRQLVRHRMRHGADGWILLVDFTDYFNSISHDAAKTLVSKSLDDPMVIDLACRQIDTYGDRGLGLGSEPSQIIAVALPSPIDWMALRNPDVLFAGRYMDDSYFASLSKDSLWRLLDAIRLECAKLGLSVNERKTKIVKISHGFTFLKRKFSFTDSGRVLVRPCRSTLTRQRRKLRSHARLVEKGRMTPDQARRAYMSMRGMLKHMDAHTALLALDAQFRLLYKEKKGNKNDR